MYHNITRANNSERLNSINHRKVDKYQRQQCTHIQRGSTNVIKSTCEVVGV